MSTRPKIEYKNDSTSFIIKTFDYQKQFSHLYSHRLAELTTLLATKAHREWGTEYQIKKLCELREEQTDSCIIIGTIYKHQIHKPSILREISEENQLAPQPPRLHYADAQDKLILEDELQRVRLQGNVDLRLLATGVVCAVLGNIEEDGRFDVKKLLFYESGPQRLLPTLNIRRILVLISGLDQLHSDSFEDSLNLFQHWLGGNIGQEKNLVRLIIAGNSVRTEGENKSTLLNTRNNTEANSTTEAMRALDTWFAAWSRSISIDIMPGAHDPANFMLPQQPFHNCMFPHSSQNTSFRCVTNPYACTMDDVSILGCSGQNVHDLLRCTMLEEPLEALRCTLTWSHIAPTAPDTLACYPYITSDPFVLRECPHIYFAGNCDSFATDLHISTDGNRTRLICIPKFSVTRSVAVVDLETLECRQVSFNTTSD